jgi:predicted metal-dependent hydrolase
MRRPLQYTLDLFGPLSVADKEVLATKSIAQIEFVHPLSDRKVQLGNAIVGYQFRRARRRTIGFIVGPEGLVVRAPRWTPLYEVDAALQDKADWIVRKLRDVSERQARRDGERMDWRDGASLAFLGSSVTLRLDPAHTTAEPAALREDSLAQGQACLSLCLPGTAAPEQIRDTVQAWLMLQAKDNFTQRLDFYAQGLQVHWRKLRLSNAKTRWGSACADGSINLNWRLIHFPQQVIDYVVVHELSHLRFMNHSAQFWSLVRTAIPDYAARRKRLKEDAIPQW